MNLNEKIEQVIEKEIKQGYMEIEEDDLCLFRRYGVNLQEQTSPKQPMVNMI